MTRRTLHHLKLFKSVKRFLSFGKTNVQQFILYTYKKKKEEEEGKNEKKENKKKKKED